MVKVQGLKFIKEHSYSWADGFLITNESYKGGPRQVDWDTVKKFVESKEFDRIEVGLAEDYNQTHAVIYRDGEVNIEENDGAGFYGSSRWATPAVKLFKNGESHLYECWVFGNFQGFPEWLLLD